MNTPATTEAGLLERLAKRRNYREEVRRLVAERPLVVFYGCGAILNSIVETWNEQVARKIDFCCDSDPAKWGRSFAGGIPCISPDELRTMKDRCTVFVTIGQFRPVFDALRLAGFPSVNLIYKYDLVTSEFLATHDDREIAAKLAAARNLMADPRSLQVFDAILNRILSERHDPAIMPAVCEPDQYFPADIIKLTDHESFVDIGAFNGDTVQDLVARTGGKFDRITCFEVDRNNYLALQENVRKLSCASRIHIHNLGIWDSECDITYSIGQSQSTVGQGEAMGHVVPLDSILGDEPVSFIKMDIEGAEPQALSGATRIIRAQKPRLAVCVYHHIRHLWDIPLAIHELAPDYKIDLRHHTNLEYETVCYAVR